MKKALATLAAFAFTISAQASDWAGGSAVWSNDFNPGWNGTGVPNGIGAVANFGVAITGNTTQDIVAGITVGTISLTNNSNSSRTITNTNGIIMNQDGAGAGSATISNTNTDTGSLNFLLLSTGTLTLADNLLISNTGASTNTTGAIQIASAIAGTGNITFSNAINNVSQTGSIRLQTGVNTFVGSVLVRQGTVSYNLATAFGNAANIVTLGQSGSGGATLISTAGVGSNNNIVVASGTTGTLTLGSVSTAATGGTYAGSLTLNGNVSLTSANTGATTGLKFTGAITGGGTITKVGAGSVVFSGAGVNDYSGGTLINAGTLAVLKDNGLGTGNVSLTASGVTLTLQGGITNNYIADNVDLSIVTGTTINLNFTGTDVVGSLTVDGIAQAPGVYGTGSLPELFGTGTLTVIPEPSTYAMMFVGAGLLFGMRWLRRKTS